MPSIFTACPVQILIPELYCHVVKVIAPVLSSSLAAANALGHINCTHATVSLEVEVLKPFNFL